MPGIGLLLLRAALGGVTLFEGAGSLTASPAGGAYRWVVGLVAVAAGVGLLLGYLTPLASLVALLTSLAGELAWFARSPGSPLGAGLAAGLGVVIAAALLCLGPGAFSLDARLFGRREIVIPANAHQPRL